MRGMIGRDSEVKEQPRVSIKSSKMPTLKFSTSVSKCSWQRWSDLSDCIDESLAESVTEKGHRIFVFVRDHLSVQGASRSEGAGRMVARKASGGCTGRMLRGMNAPS
jgi:hypothetical protein